MTDSAWDRLLDVLDQRAAAHDAPSTAALEGSLAPLVSQAITEGDIDSELAVDDVTRWLAGLVNTFDAVRAAHPEVEADLDLANLRRLVTRWLHPARPR